jgi:two-component system, chemotaxis family, sensor kinase CheA
LVNMVVNNKLTNLVQQAATSIMMAEASDLSDVENLDRLLDEISECVQQVSHLPEDLKAQAGSATASAGKLMARIFSKETKNTEASLRSVSETIMALQDMLERVNTGADPKKIKVRFPSTIDNPKPLPQAQDGEVEPTMIEEDNVDLFVNFIKESGEHIELLETGLLEVENNPEDIDAINLVLRGFHTIKGMTGFLDLVEIGYLTDAIENLLDLCRKGNLNLVGTNMDVVFESVDMLKTMISNLQTAINGDKVVPSVTSLSQLLGRIKICSQGNPKEIAAPVPASAEENIAKTPVEKSNVVTEEAKQQQNSQDAAKAKHSAADEKIKVSTSRLDNLVNMVGELVISQAMVTQAVEASLAPEHQLCQNVVQQGKRIRELQELSMMMRMVPIQGVFQKMARLVRDLCRSSGKKVDFITEGEETELDRIVVDQIADPLVHMIRNSIDHGIESDEDRMSAGKSTNGRVKLRACHQGGNVVIEIEDDGKGLDKEKILKKAIDNGVISSGQELSDQEIFKLIFHAGLSTAAKVTEVSGRGVGMDVVKKNIDSLRGKIEIDSTPGKGTIFTIRLPLTMAIIDGQVVRVGQENYIIPIVSIDHCLKPKDKQISTVAGKAEMVMVQRQLIPMVRMCELFGIQDDRRDPQECSIVVVEGDGKKGCLMVDELLGQQQVVIKSLGGIGTVKGVSGGAIMGNGRVSLIIDVPGLLDIAWQ